MPHLVHDIAIAKQIGAYSDAIEAAPGLRWLLTSGTPGLEQSGKLPSDIAGQAEIAWMHIVALLASAGMDVHDLIKVSHYIVRVEDIPAYVNVRARFLGDARPASMLLLTPALVRPEFLLEIEAVAAKR